MRTLFPKHAELVGKVMDLQLQRQNVVMSNLANIKTPGWKAQKLEFEQDLQAALGRDARGKMAQTDQQHAPATFHPESFQGDFLKEFQPHVVHGQDQVDLDKEMATMSKNSMMYNALTTVLKRHFDGMRTAIQEGAK